MIEASTVNKIDFVTKWVETLRTTDIPQGRVHLSTDVGDCCLGIACRVGEDMNICGAGFEPGSQQRGNSYSPGRWFTDVMGTTQLTVNHPSLREPHDIVYLNDEARWSFAQIADALEYTFLRNVENSTPTNA